MVRYFLVCLLSLVLLSVNGPGHTATPTDISVPDTMTAGQQELRLNGTGLRTKYLFKLYVAGLYLPQPEHNAKAIIMQDTPMAIRLQIMSSIITSKRMQKNTRKGFKRATNGKITPIADRMERLINVFTKGINKDDVFEMIYQPATGITVHKNGTLMVTIPGLDFKQAFFGIWLCDQPAQESLKQALLGQ